MKTIKALFFLLTASVVVGAQAGELSAPEALDYILAPKTYFGADCSMEISQDLGQAAVTGRKAGEELTVVIEEGVSYRWQPGQRYYISGTMPYVFMTRMVEENVQYMVVEKELEEGRKTIECIVSI